MKFPKLCVLFLLFLFLSPSWMNHLQSMEKSLSFTSDEYIHYMQLRMVAEYIISTANQIKISGETFPHSDVRKSHEATPYFRTKQGILLEIRNTSAALLSSLGSWEILTFAPEKTFKEQLIENLSKSLEINVANPKEPKKERYAITKIDVITLPPPELKEDYECPEDEYQRLKRKWKTMTEKYNKENIKS